MNLLTLEKKPREHTHQSSDPIHWELHFKKTSFNTYRFEAVGFIKSPWHLYATETDQVEFPPTKIIFDENILLYPSGPLKETGGKQTHYNTKHQTEISYYKTKVHYTQDFQVFKHPESIKGTIYYTPCTEDHCLVTAVKTFDIRP